MAYLGFLFTVLLAICTQNGEALRCWSCSSDLDPACLDHFNTTQLLQRRSYFQQSNINPQYQRNDVPSLIECAFNLGQSYNQKQVCVKRVINVPYGRKIISRECKTVSTMQSTGTCPDRNNNVEFCEYCEYDGCNAATGLTTNLLLAVAIPCTMLLFFRR